MELNKKIRVAKYGYIILSVLICALGLTLIAMPDFSLNALCKLGGVLLIGFGCIKIVGYLGKDLYRLAFQFDLGLGMLLMILGLNLIFRLEAVIPAICILLGIFILTDSLLKIQIAIDAREFGISLWWIILGVAVFTAVAGVFVLFRPCKSARMIMMILGISLLGEGLLNLTTVLTAVKIHQRRQLQYDK